MSRLSASAPIIHVFCPKGPVVVILTGAPGARTATIGRSLAHELGWPLLKEGFS